MKKNHSSVALPTKEVENNLYIPVLIDIIDSGNEVPLTVSGWSMVPFLVSDRDTIVMGTPKERFKKGDMALFKREDGSYVMHRICKIDKNGDYYFVGDSQTVIEGPIKASDVFAHVKRVCRKGKWLKSGDFLWDFFERFWIYTVKLRPTLFKIHAFVKKHVNNTKSK